MHILPFDLLAQLHPSRDNCLFHAFNFLQKWNSNTILRACLCLFARYIADRGSGRASVLENLNEVGVGLMIGWATTVVIIRAGRGTECEKWKVFQRNGQKAATDPDCLAHGEHCLLFASRELNSPPDPNALSLPFERARWYQIMKLKRSLFDDTDRPALLRLEHPIPHHKQ